MIVTCSEHLSGGVELLLLSAHSTKVTVRPLTGKDFMKMGSYPQCSTYGCSRAPTYWMDE